MKRNIARDWSGKIAGGLFGLLAGPYGLFLGFLVGHLFDVLKGISRVRGEIGRFLDFPEGSPLNEEKGLLYSYACLLGSIVLVSGENPKRNGNYLIDRIRERLPVRDEDLRYLQELFTLLETGEAGPNLREHAEAVRRRMGEHDPAALFAGLEAEAGHRLRPRGSPASALLGIVAALWDTVYEEGPTEPENSSDSWTVLGLEPEASKEEVKRVYRVLAAQFHPDGGSVLNDLQRRETEEAFKRIKRAYDDCMESVLERGGRRGR